jgi:hypothetical protein
LARALVACAAEEKGGPGGVSQAAGVGLANLPGPQAAAGQSGSAGLTAQQQQQQPQQQQVASAVTRIGGVRRTSAILLTRTSVDGSRAEAGRLSADGGSGGSPGAWDALADYDGGANEEDEEEEGAAEARGAARRAAEAAAAADSAVDAVLAGLAGTGAGIKTCAAGLLELVGADEAGGARRAVARILARMEG